MKILKKLPRWLSIALMLVIAVIMASAFVQHVATKSRVDERIRDIKERQKIIWSQMENGSDGST